ncbi:ABC transporter permease [Methylomicrobium agile]|uniref:ABC transporter permease n=1 Tax=Methylomicrobium agile TaxID=39774 RepID=UPI0004DF4EA2|nr:ABC transporter permease [Methylomicrobium agile]
MMSSGFWAFVARTLAESLENWRYALFRMVFQPFVYLLVFGKILGQALSGSGYSLTVGPGIIAMLVMNTALNSIGGLFSRGYYFRSMEGWLLAPLSLRALMLAWVTGTVLIATFAGLIGSLILYLLLGYQPVSPWTELLCLLYGAAAFALLCCIGYTLPSTPAKAQDFLAFLLMPMMFLGCTFFSYAMLESPWNVVALLLPTTYLSEALRIVYGSQSSALDPTQIVGGGIAALILLFIVADWSFRRRFRDFLW